MNKAINHIDKKIRQALGAGDVLGVGNAMYGEPPDTPEMKAFASFLAASFDTTMDGAAMREAVVWSLGLASHAGAEPVAPEGWKLVPIKLTENMLICASEDYSQDLAENVWATLLAAAPGAAIAAREQGSDHARFDYMARSLRSIADRGRAELGDSYPEILSLCITMRDLASREEAPTATRAELVASLKRLIGSAVNYPSTERSRGWVREVYEKIDALAATPPAATPAAPGEGVIRAAFEEGYWANNRRAFDGQTMDDLWWVGSRAYAALSHPAPVAAPAPASEAVAVTSGAIYEIVKSTRLVPAGSAIEIANRVSAALVAERALAKERLKRFIQEYVITGLEKAAEVEVEKILATPSTGDSADAPVQQAADRRGVYAWVTPTGHASLVLVSKRPTEHSRSGVLNASVIESVKFYDGCAVDEWGKDGRWVLLHDFDAALKGEQPEPSGGERGDV